MQRGRGCSTRPGCERAQPCSAGTSCDGRRFLGAVRTQIHHRRMRDFREICWSKSNQLTGCIYSRARPRPPRQMGSAVRAGPRSEKPALFGLSSRPEGMAEALTCPWLLRAGEVPSQDLAALGPAVGRGASPAHPALANAFWTRESSSPFALLLTPPRRGNIIIQIITERQKCLRKILFCHPFEALFFGGENSCAKAN